MGSEDSYGLYEVIWTLNTQYPSIATGEKVRAAIAVFEALLNDGLIEVFESGEWSVAGNVPLDPGHARDVVAAADSWLAPDERDGPPYYQFYASGRQPVERV